MIAAAPQACQGPGFFVGEYCRTVNNARSGGVIQRNLDHVDAEQGSTLIPGHFVDAPFHFVCFAYPGRTGVIDHDAAEAVGA